jgi:hypothetical protein
MNAIFDIWPTMAEMAQDLGLPYQTVAAWRSRGIPYRRFEAVLRAAEARGHALTLEDLLNERAAFERRGRAA